MSDLNELGHRQELLKSEVARLSQHPARIHGLSEEDRADRVCELNQELELVRQEIEQAATARNQRHIHQVYGTAGHEVTEAAKLELKLAEEALANSLAQFESQTRGYCRKLHAAQQAVFSAAGNAGQSVRRPDMVLSALGLRLGKLVEDTVRHG